MSQNADNNEGFNEQRRFTRINFDADARLVGADGNARCHLFDLSLKGALIKPPAGWSTQIDDRFVLELALDADKEVMIRMEMAVSHIEDDHVGLRCEHIDLDSITHLRRLVELNLGDAELLNRELTALSKA